MSTTRRRSGELRVAHGHRGCIDLRDEEDVLFDITRPRVLDTHIEAAAAIEVNRRAVTALFTVEGETARARTGDLRRVTPLAATNLGDDSSRVEDGEAILAGQSFQRAAEGECDALRGGTEVDNIVVVSTRGAEVYVVLAPVVAELVGVVALATIDLVATRSAFDDVVTLPRDDRVAAIAAIDLVVGIGSRDLVVPRTSEDDAAAAAEGDDIVPIAAIDREADARRSDAG